MRQDRLIPRLVALILSCALLLGLFTFVAPPAMAAGGWSTQGTTITGPTGTFVISGINWYGFETTGFVAHGLYAQDYRKSASGTPGIVDQIKQYGYNTIRIPFSNEMWRKNPVPKPNLISACPSCKNKTSREILAMIINYAASLGLHVILDNHRSEAGNSAEANGLWYSVSKGNNYSDTAWSDDWSAIQQRVNTTLSPTTLSDGPVVLGYDLRNEPHTHARTSYLKGATCGAGDPDGCAASSSCHDWRLAAERVGNRLLNEANAKSWPLPLIFVEGVGLYPADGGTAASGPYDGYWWGGNLLGVKGNSTNPAAPVRLAYPSQLVYSVHDYGPTLYAQSWFASGKTCYTTYNSPGCQSATSLADVWNKYWGYVNADLKQPIYIGEFGTGNNDTDLSSTVKGSQGQWFTDLVNFIQRSYATNPSSASNYSGFPVSSLNWTSWALNGEDSSGLLNSNYNGLANANKEYSLLCYAQQPPFAVQVVPNGLCGSTPMGPLPAPQ